MKPRGFGSCRVCGSVEEVDRWGLVRNHQPLGPDLEDVLFCKGGGHPPLGEKGVSSPISSTTTFLGLLDGKSPPLSLA